MDSSRLLEFVDRLRRSKPSYDWQPTAPEPGDPPWMRRLTSCEPPSWETPSGNVDEARLAIRQAIRSYLAEPNPGEILLVRAMPGTGKSTAAVEIVEELAAAGKRVLYAGPRHDFYLDLLEKSADRGLWYEWQPRQAGDDDKPQTCNYPAQIETWMQRGYQAMDFCSGVCGWTYIQTGCPYHAQRRRPEPIIYGQHQHVALGHPVKFDVLLGDESPLQAFAHEWRIPSGWIMPRGMDPTEPLAEMLFTLQSLAGSVDRAVSGPELLDALGGASEVAQAVEAFEMPAAKINAWASIHEAKEAGEKDYFHLFALAGLLVREAAQAAAGTPYPHRIIVSPGHLTLLLRRRPKELPNHVVWLDATGRERIYGAVFDRRVRVVEAGAHLQGRIYQVVDRANGKSAAEKGKADLRRLVESIAKRYARPVVVGFKAFVEGLEIEHSHFYAARGTNQHEDADAVLIAGAPQANIYDIVKMAKMLFWERDTAFRPEWVTKEAVYRHIAADGQGRAYPVSGFWNDPDLQAVLETVREDEILQAAHRGRPVNHPLDIWLLTNVPIDALPPDELLTNRDALGAPDGVNVFKWAEVQKVMDGQDTITAADLQALGLNYETARRYLEIVGQQPGWEPAAVKSGRGRPTKQAKRIRLNADYIINDSF